MKVMNHIKYILLVKIFTICCGFNVPPPKNPQLVNKNYLIKKIPIDNLSRTGKNIKDEHFPAIDDHDALYMDNNFKIRQPDINTFLTEISIPQNNEIKSREGLMEIPNTNPPNYMQLLFMINEMQRQNADKRKDKTKITPENNENTRVDQHIQDKQRDILENSEAIVNQFNSDMGSLIFQNDMKNVIPGSLLENDFVPNYQNNNPVLPEIQDENQQLKENSDGKNLQAILMQLIKHQQDIITSTKNDNRRVSSFLTTTQPPTTTTASLNNERYIYSQFIKQLTQPSNQNKNQGSINEVNPNTREHLMEVLNNLVSIRNNTRRNNLVKITTPSPNNIFGNQASLLFPNRLTPNTPQESPIEDIDGNIRNTVTRSVTYTSIQDCLKNTLCSFAIAVAVAASTTGAIAVPLLAPLFGFFGRRRRNIDYLMITPSNSSNFIENSYRFLNGQEISNLTQEESILFNQFKDEVPNELPKDNYLQVIKFLTDNRNNFIGFAKLKSNKEVKNDDDSVVILPIFKDNDKVTSNPEKQAILPEPYTFSQTHEKTDEKETKTSHSKNNFHNITKNIDGNIFQTDEYSSSVKETSSNIVKEESKNSSRTEVSHLKKENEFSGVDSNKLVEFLKLKNVAIPDINKFTTTNTPILKSPQIFNSPIFPINKNNDEFMHYYQQIQIVESLRKKYIEKILNDYLKSQLRQQTQNKPSLQTLNSISSLESFEKIKKYINIRQSTPKPPTLSPNPFNIKTSQKFPSSDNPQDSNLEIKYFYQVLCNAIVGPDIPLNKVTTYIAEKCIVMRHIGIL